MSTEIDGKQLEVLVILGNSKRPIPYTEFEERSLEIALSQSVDLELAQRTEISVEQDLDEKASSYELSEKGIEFLQDLIDYANIKVEYEKNPNPSI